MQEHIASLMITFDSLSIEVAILRSTHLKQSNIFIIAKPKLVCSFKAVLSNIPDITESICKESEMRQKNLKTLLSKELLTSLKQACQTQQIHKLK